VDTRPDRSPRARRKGTFDAAKIGKAAYRPFCQSWIYYDQQFNEYFKEKLYPSANYKI